MFGVLKRLLREVIFKDGLGITSFRPEGGEKGLKGRDETNHSEPAFRKGAFITIAEKEKR